MKNPSLNQRIICFISFVLLMVAMTSIFVVGASAEQRAGEPVVGGYYPMVLRGDNFYIEDTFYVLPKSPDIYSSYICHALSCYNGVISLETHVFKPTSQIPDIYFFEYDPSTHFLVGDFDNSLVSINFMPESNSTFSDIYPYTINPGFFLRCTPCRGQSYYSRLGPFNFYEYSNGVYNHVTSAESISFIDTTTLHVSADPTSYDYNLSLSRHNNYYVTVTSPISFTFTSEDMYEFYCYFVPEQFPDILEEDEPGESIPQVIMTVVNGFFDGLAQCYVFPGVSIMTIVYSFFGILIFRYIIKLLAGG